MKEMERWTTDGVFRCTEKVYNLFDKNGLVYIKLPYF